MVNVGDRVFFETDRPSLRRRRALRSTSRRSGLQQYANYTFTIEGHADERGTREYNIALGARRAQKSATTSPRAASRPTACAPSPTARSARLRFATTFRAGRRTAAL